MKPLTPPDQLFLWLEKGHQPMHVGGLLLGRPPAGAPADFVQKAAENMRQWTKAEPPFDQRLVRKLGTWFWAHDEDFDVEHHFRHLALPKPGRIRELLALVSQLHAAHLDRSRPLWELYLIDGVEDGRFAIYSKIHHSLVDGVAAMRMVQRALSTDPDERDRPPPWAVPHPKHRRERDDFGDLPLADVWGAVRTQVAAVPTIAREIMKTIRDARGRDEARTSLRAPACILNQSITSSRRFAAQSYSLDRIREVGKSFHATVNDVVLAMCASALRRYLQDLDALPDKPLVAMVPLSLRRDDSAAGNQVAMILVNLATHLDDPLERLETIQRSVQHSKERYSHMTPAEILGYTGTLLGPAGLNFLTGAAPRVQAFNVIISNVPGPKAPLYYNGARIEGMYPVSIVVDGQALNLTLNSYVDKLEFGVIACRRTLPSVQRMLEYLETGLHELEAVAAVNNP
ncbi:MAG: wax ester/triacylglycerol synthase family O-acyltransferase [Deltaproteobacteria bacterium]|nr:wax ester/triacylglycerol synthase family O-acyltransferase [Deltaproteobacteria bacterium]